MVADRRPGPRWVQPLHRRPAALAPRADRAVAITTLRHRPPRAVTVVAADPGASAVACAHEHF